MSAARAVINIDTDAIVAKVQRYVDERIAEAMGPIIGYRWVRSDGKVMLLDPAEVTIIRARPPGEPP